MTIVVHRAKVTDAHTLHLTCGLFHQQQHQQLSHSIILESSQYIICTVSLMLLKVEQ